MTKEIDLVDRAITYWSEYSISRPIASHEDYLLAMEYIYATLEENNPRTYKVFTSLSEAWHFVATSISDSADELSAYLFHPRQPCLGGYACADLLAAIDVAEQTGRDVAFSPEAQNFKKLSKIACFWPLDEMCVFVEPPVLQVDSGYRLHNETGPAVDFGGKDRLYYLHGIKLDEQIIMRPETQTLAQIINERNADIQTIRIERYGWLRLLGEIDAEVLDERENAIEGTLEVLYKTALGRKLVAVCPTGKIPVMGVPESCETCEQAQKWLGSEGSGIRVLGRS